MTTPTDTYTRPQSELRCEDVAAPDHSWIADRSPTGHALGTLVLRSSTGWEVNGCAVDEGTLVYPTELQARVAACFKYHCNH